MSNDIDNKLVRAFIDTAWLMEMNKINMMFTTIPEDELIQLKIEFYKHHGIDING